MNKSKFKTVKFKPFDMELFFQDKSKGLCWTNTVLFGNSSYNDVYFTDSFIEAYPELFEVEEAEREFEAGANYKARLAPLSDIEIVKCWGSYFTLSGINKNYFVEDFFEIGEKIEL